jgi:hypothetical protein
MSRIAVAAVAALLASSALAEGQGPAPKAVAPRAPQGKPQAPATVAARLGPGTATVTVRFSSPATDVSIDVHGVDGLMVTSAATPVSGVRFARGETVTFDVAFTEGPGRSHLAVAVSGSFAGGRRATVQTFAVGTPTPEQLKASVPATTDSTGQRIKVMPAEGR